MTGHGVSIVWFVLTRFPYDRLGLAAGFLLHVAWLYLLYIYADRKVRRRIAIVPFGAAGGLTDIHGVDWHLLKRPLLHDTRACHAIVADFSADMPDEWEAFLADAALAGRIVYQVKQLSESLTGRVELEHLSENSFGSLFPARGYFYLKALIDFLCALAMIPIVLPLMVVIAAAIRPTAAARRYSGSKGWATPGGHHHLQVPDHALCRRGRGTAWPDDRSGR